MAELFSADRSWPTFVPLQDGAVILGGAVASPEGEGDRRLQFPSEAVFVGADGEFHELSPPPVEAGLTNVMGSGFGDEAVFVGTVCEDGATVDDSGRMTCSPGEAAMVRFDSVALSWSEVPMPQEATEPGRFLGDQGIYLLADGAMVYTVQADVEDGVRQGWISLDQGDSWRTIEVPSGFICASGGRLTAVSDETPPPFVDELGVVSSELLSPEPLVVSAAVFEVEADRWEDLTIEDPGMDVLPGGAEGHCTPNAGYVSLLMTGGTSGSAFWLHPDGTWGSVDPHDEMLSGASVMYGTKVVLGALGGPPSTLDTAVGTMEETRLEPGDVPVGGVGESNLLVLKEDRSRVMLVSV